MIAWKQSLQTHDIVFSLKIWFVDQSKFGQRMLEKMGWQSGKGLGANEDGSTQHIKVSVKNNTLGKKHG